MSLVAFHKLLIVTAILFCGLFAGWQLLEYLRMGGIEELLVGVTFAAATIGFVLYLRRLQRFLGREPRR